ncbi:flagellin [Acidaminobacter sp. JC074]|uniref:flagellin n=1 Tax=Acidaminobacter sp. JC074 TaxID=2530199 RepID=UPI001F0E8491|nr:flagellin [Acidaminobacter sp. JC074]
MKIRHNVSMMTIINNRSNIMMEWSKSFRRLSSGKRITCPADDPAGFMISERMKSQIRGLRQASRNAQDAISLVQTAESGMGEMVDILQRMRELYVQASNGTLTDSDKEKIGYEIDELKEALVGIHDHTEFNTMGLLDGRDFTFLTGGNEGDSRVLHIEDMSLSFLGLDNLKDMSSDDLDSNITIVDDALKRVSSQRSSLGAQQSGLEATIRRLDIQAENLQAAESRITDLDIAKEMMNFAKLQMLAQVNDFLLAHAKSDAEMVLSLLKPLN